MDLASSLEAKFGARPSKLYEIRGKRGKFCYHAQDAKVGRKSQFWGHPKFRVQNLGYLSPILLEAKFWGSNKNFKGKILGPSPRTTKIEDPLGSK